MLNYMYLFIYCEADGSEPVMLTSPPPGDETIWRALFQNAISAIPKRNWFAMTMASSLIEFWIRAFCLSICTHIYMFMKRSFPKHRHCKLDFWIGAYPIFGKELPIYCLAKSLSVIKRSPYTHYTLPFWGIGESEDRGFESRARMFRTWSSQPKT